jgi:hypothetical protein
MEARDRDIMSPSLSAPEWACLCVGQLELARHTAMLAIKPVATRTIEHTIIAVSTGFRPITHPPLPNRYNTTEREKFHSPQAIFTSRRPGNLDSNVTPQ